MKRVVLSIIFVSFCIFSFAQVPESFNYQAIVRDGGATVSEQSVFYRFSIIKGELPGEVVYTEKHNPVTSEIGLVTLAIGKGTDKSGAFTAIDWGVDIYSLNVELDLEGDGSYADMGTTQLLSVPYAMHSKTATNYTETDPLFGGWDKSTGISIPASQVSDFQSSVTDNAAVLANTAKNSYPAADATKLAGIAEGAEVNINADWNATSGDAQILNKPTTIAGYGITDAVTTIGDQTITGNKTFTGITIVPTPVNANNAATKAYVDSKTPTHYIGESYGGGIVFYVDNTGQHGLISSTSDQSAGIRWNAGTDMYTLAGAEGVGSGKENTSTILHVQGYGDGGQYAARICNEYTITVDGTPYGNWYLPSNSELSLLYLQRSVVGGFSNAIYWSSTEYNEYHNYTARSFNFITGFVSADVKNDYTLRVRAIKTF